MKLAYAVIQRIYALRDIGWSHNAIAAELEISTSTVLYWLQQRDLERMRETRKREGRGT